MNYSHFVGLDVGKNTFDASLMSSDEKDCELCGIALSETETIQIARQGLGGIERLDYCT